MLLAPNGKVTLSSVLFYLKKKKGTKKAYLSTATTLRVVAAVAVAGWIVVAASGGTLQPIEGGKVHGLIHLLQPTIQTFETTRF